MAVLAGLLFSVLFVLPAQAHDVFSSLADVHVRADHIEVVLTISRSNALRLIPEGTRLPAITPENFGDYRDKLIAIGPDLFVLTANDVPLALLGTDSKISGEDDVAFHLRYPRPHTGPLKIFGQYLGWLIDGHVGTLVVRNAATGKDLGWSPISIDQPTFQVSLPRSDPGSAVVDAAASSPSRPGFSTFLRLGVHHILIGYDHLLFLFGLLIVCRKFRTMIAIITCFTLAHSITLGLAAFDVVTLSPRVVEPLIAASIVFVGVENLLLRGEEPKRRWLLTFVFGLIHGFGFAGALKEVGVGLSGTSLALPLFSFNLGVEIGQIAVAAVCLPLLLLLRRQPKFVRVGPPIISSLVVLAGGYWLLQRTVLT